MRRIQTSIAIEASPEAVWEALMDFDAYPEWNPFITSIVGEASPGSRLEVTIRPPGRKAMRFRPIIQPSKGERHFHWLGRAGFKGLFDGHHEFRVESSDGEVVFHHGETFTGILVPLLWRSLEASTRKGFVAMNEALKRRVEPAED